MDELPVLLIDNRSPVCCNMMQYLFKCGGYNRFNFLSIYSDQGRELLMKYGITAEVKNHLILFDQGKVYLNTGAFFQTAQKVKGALPVFYWYTVLPDNIGKSEASRVSEYSSNKK